MKLSLLTSLRWPRPRTPIQCDFFCFVRCVFVWPAKAPEASLLGDPPRGLAAPSLPHPLLEFPNPYYISRKRGRVGGCVFVRDVCGICPPTPRPPCGRQNGCPKVIFRLGGDTSLNKNHQKHSVGGGLGQKRPEKGVQMVSESSLPKRVPEP